MYGQDVEFAFVCGFYFTAFVAVVSALAGLARLGLWVIDKIGGGVGDGE